MFSYFPGEIFLDKVLDYEANTHHNFTVRATFLGGYTSHVTVDIAVININDNKPYFINSTYIITVHEFTQVGSHVVQVLATDVDDRNSMRMSIASGNANALFTIAQTTGVITLNKAPYLYPENTYTLMIGLVDSGGLQANVQATVTVNIARMTAASAGCQIFGSNSYAVVTISETAPIGSLVIDLTGTPVAPGRTIMYDLFKHICVS